MRSSPRSGTDGGGPIRSASTAGLGRCGRAGRNAAFRPAEKRGRRALRLRFMTEQPPYSLLVRGIDADVLPVAEQFGMGVLPWLLARRSRSRLGDTGKASYSFPSYWVRGGVARDQRSTARQRP